MSFTRDLGLERMCLFPLNYLTADNMVVISAAAYKDHAVCLPHCQSGLLLFLYRVSSEVKRRTAVFTSVKIFLLNWDNHVFRGQFRYPSALLFGEV